ncbi:aspartate/glutamate racemase family protein [Sphingobacterium bambusae]|uniref:Aspartate/glutamate racemase family protein n=1 Tax=Sphingobacterium bambusae TaxID=662858 RepID=A0ABW6BIP1_9SPHI|nr:amino acid racemase [Sphingobacterium bambusae]WPL50859.1 amino acid racemase [Sphingobacterium bambusae]
MIGIVGGVGALAGLDIATKIIEETKVSNEREHLPLLLHAHAQRISDPAAYLIGRENENPAKAIAQTICELETAGATIVAVPSHAAHASRIFDLIREELEHHGSQVKLLHMIEETALYIQRKHGHQAVAVLSSLGTKNNGLYQHALTQHGLQALEPDQALQDKIQEAIYDPTYGIQAVSAPVSNRARSEIIKVIAELKKKGAQSIVFGDADFALAIPEKESDGLPIVDPNRVLARALIAAYDESKLRSEEVLANA